MGSIGRWLATLEPEDRDAIIRHPDPTYNGTDWGPSDYTPESCHCLVGTVVERRLEAAGVGRAARLAPYPIALHTRGLLDDDAELEWHNAGVDFPALTGRFGPERVWRAVKMRCAKLNGASELVERIERGEVVEPAGAA